MTQGTFHAVNVLPLTGGRRENWLEDRVVLATWIILRIITMADTRVQLEVEDWVRRDWMRKEYGCEFHRERLRLSPGGVFDFDAVSDDRIFAATISTSSARTASGKLGVGKKMKIRSDIYFLRLSEASRKVVVFTERDMYDEWAKEKEAGRVPKDIEFALAALPQNLDAKLQRARKKASDEVTPA